MGDSHGEAKHMKVTDLEWHTRDDGETWSLVGCVTQPQKTAKTARRLFEIQYLGRGRGPRGLMRGLMRWKVYDRRYWIDDPADIPEFLDLDEAKAWVEAVVRLDP
jgi:hypothetical protein